MHRSAWDPFHRGPFPAGVRTFTAHDPARRRTFPIEAWYPAHARHAGEDLADATRDAFHANRDRRQDAVRDARPAAGDHPLILFSTASGSHRRSATFLCTHLASHGYVVAALDPSEIVAPELSRRDGETREQETARREAIIASRVPDLRFLLDRMLAGLPRDFGVRLDPSRIGIAGHSFGGWAALATIDVEPRIGALVALAPGGASNPRPGILRTKLEFRWGRDVPTLFLVADGDVCLPLAGMHEIFARTPATKRMFVLHRADHGHFMDDVEHVHELTRNMEAPEEIAWLPREMRPIAELCSGETAHRFTRGLATCHFDATLREEARARAFLEGDVVTALARGGIEATAIAA